MTELCVSRNAISCEFEPARDSGMTPSSPPRSSHVFGATADRRATAAGHLGHFPSGWPRRRRRRPSSAGLRRLTRSARDPCSFNGRAGASPAAIALMVVGKRASSREISRRRGCAASGSHQMTRHKKHVRPAVAMVALVAALAAASSASAHHTTTGATKRAILESLKARGRVNNGHNCETRALSC